MRLFIALPLPTSVCNALEKSCNQLKPHLEKGSIVSKQNYHITMHFLGEVSIDKIAYLQNALDHSAQECSAPTLSVNQLSTLSGAGIVCGKFKFDNKLTTLYDKLKSELDSIGFDTDNHKYTPHVTLVRRYKFCEPFREVIKSVDCYNKPFVCNSLTLYDSSFVGNNTVHYTPIYTVNLRELED